MTSQLANKVALITGGARGMGKAIAERFVAEGAAVGLLDIEQEEMDALVETLQADGGRAMGRVADVRDYKQIQEAVTAVIEALGPIDILVNSAGLQIAGLVHEVGEEEWDLGFDVNVKGTMLVTKAVLPGMLQRQEGQIINIASLAAWIWGWPGATCYGATKYAVRGFSRYLNKELRPQNIKVCCVSPGSCNTNFRGELTANPNWMEPEDVADTVLFVATRRDGVSVAEVGFSHIAEGW